MIADCPTCPKPIEDHSLILNILKSVPERGTPLKIDEIHKQEDKMPLLLELLYKFNFW